MTAPRTLNTSPASQMIRKSSDSPSAEPRRKFSMICGEKTTTQHAIEIELIAPQCQYRHHCLTCLIRKRENPPTYTAQGFYIYIVSLRREHGVALKNVNCGTGRFPRTTLVKIVSYESLVGISETQWITQSN